MCVCVCIYIYVCVCVYARMSICFTCLIIETLRNFTYSRHAL